MRKQKANGCATGKQANQKKKLLATQIHKRAQMKKLEWAQFWVQK
jgi:hypothetical protein